MPTTSNFGWTTPADTDLVKDGAAAIRTLGNGVDTSMAQLKGGTTGQVLSKTSNTDMAFTWVTQDDANAIQNAIIDAKGDIITGTANDTPAILSVGSNGSTLVADSSTATGLRWNVPPASLANPVINGGFEIWQRGTSLAFANSTTNYTADRWLSVATQTGTVSRQATNDTTNLPNIRYCARIQRTSGQTGTSEMIIYNPVETSNAIPFAGKAVTVSFYARAGANYSPTGSALATQLQTGTGTDQNPYSYTGGAIVNNPSFTLTTTWQRFAFNGTIGATATEFYLRFGMTPTGTAGASDYYELTGVQIDLGTYTAATAPVYRLSGGTLAGELAACQRYYWRGSTSGSGQTLCYGYAQSTTTAVGIITLPVTMRTFPSSMDYTAIVFSNYANTQSGSLTSVTLNNGTGNTIGFYGTTSGLTAGHTGYIGTNNATNYIGFSAEL